MENVQAVRALSDAPFLHRTSGREPIVLLAPTRLGLVREGTVNLFIELWEGDERPSGARQHLATLEAGDAFSVPETHGFGARLIVAGVGEAFVELCEAAGREALSLDAASGFDAWLNALTSYCARDVAPLSSRVVQRGETLGVRAGDTVAAREPSWLVSEELASLPVVGEVPSLSDKHLFGLATPYRAIAPDAGVTVRALPTADVVKLFGWGAVEACQADLVRDAISIVQGECRVALERRGFSRQSEGDEVDEALRGLVALVDGDTPAAPYGAEDADARTVVAYVCAEEKIPFDGAPRDEDGADLDPIALVRDILREAGLRSRRVTLDHDWWRHDVGSFVGFHKESGRPIAVVRQGAGRYRAQFLEAGSPVWVDARVANALDTQAVYPYRPLPDRALTGWDLVRHVMASPARVDLRLAVFFAILTAALGLLPPIITGLVLSEAVPFSETSALLMFGVGLVMIAVGSTLFQLARSIALTRLESFADGTLQAAIWDRLLRLPLAFFRRFETGDLMIKAMAPTQLRKILSDVALSSTLAALFSPVNFVLMMMYDVRLALAAGGLTVVTCVVLFGLSYRQLRFERTRLKAEASVNSLTLQILSGIKKIRLMGAEHRSFARWLAAFGVQRQQTVRASHIGNIIATINRVLPLLATLVFISVIGLSETQIAPASFVAFTAAFGVFNGALLGFVQAVSTSLAVVPMYENMKPLLDELPEIDGKRKKPGRLGGRIDLRNISFRYADDGPLILDGVDITVSPGEFVAFVGASGSGKSTLFRLLLGFETPECGTVAYDGQDLAHLDLKGVRRQIGVVLQRGAILPGSIFQNIVGSAPLSPDDAWEAARMAGLDEDIRAMPMGMHTVLSDNGGTLSGGQRQRLMIARAIVRRPGILLMDEATSALDNQTQAIVAKSLQELSATRIVIAHRLSTVTHADRIYVIDKGRVVQQGNFDRLMSEAGPFREIALPQMQ
ncbi:ATPase [Hyphomicrobium nitrativorans NL23]|uniref:ATPase n=1 Tax=Hyphomicrobium nitrativorans NL23 TaxID=1029756 RepID=V5SBW3_9HYPH|nr:NHLP bacteriocin export ABC transporter permease/ATPase subunit [Hyphomicrobium nitrativorans]AHB48366.1 ATPase [Hyphomicrobium nitrativorans NL23]